MKMEIKLKYNLKKMAKNGLDQYIKDGDCGPVQTEDYLHAIINDIFKGIEDEVDDNSVVKRWIKSPEYRCNCGTHKIWRTLKLLPVSEIEDIVATHPHPDIEIKCEFCGSLYNISISDIDSEILQDASTNKNTGIDGK